MTEPTGDEVMVRAKQLAQDDGRLWLWGSDYDQLRKARSRIVDDSLRAEYLNRALGLLRDERSDLDMAVAMRPGDTLGYIWGPQGHMALALLAAHCRELVDHAKAHWNNEVRP
jgi:hypothetical protein